MYPKTPMRSADRIIDGLDRDTLARRYQARILGLARRMLRRLPPTSRLTREDLASSGAVGLLEAMDAYDPALDVRFSTFAEFRIRGAMLDAMRSDRGLTRRQNDLQRDIREAKQALAREGGHEPGHDAVARRLGMDMQSYWEVTAGSMEPEHVPLDPMESEEGSGGLTLASPQDVVARLAAQDLREMLRGAIGGLPERHRQVLLMYYGRDLSLAEIGEVLAISDSRVCQILGEARKRLRPLITRKVEADDLDWREAI